MIAHNSNAVFNLTNNDENEEYTNPLDITDLITICQSYQKLGYQMQNQVENILENGVEEAIKSGIVKKQALPHIKDFLKSIANNFYFGDAALQANDCLALIQTYEDKYKIVYISTSN